MNKLRHTLTVRNLFLALIILSLLFNSLFAASHNLLNSDSIYANLLFPSFFKYKIYLPPDPFLIHYLFSIPINYFFGFSFTTVFLETLLLVVLTLGSFCAFYIYFIKKFFLDNKAYYYLPLLLFLNISWPFYQFISWPFERSIEFGLIFFTIFYFDDLQKRTKKTFVHLTIYLLLFIIFYSDPFFLYLFAIPLLLTLEIKRFESREYSKNLLVLGLTAFAAFISRLLLASTPLFVIYNSRIDIVFGRHLIRNFILMVKDLIYMLNFSYSPLIIFLFLLILFSFSILGLYSFFRAYYRKPNLTPLLFPIIFILTPFAFIFSDQASDLASSRYLILLLFLMPFGIAYLLYSLRSNLFKQFIIVILIVVTVANFILINSTYYGIGNSEPYKGNNVIIRTITNYNLKYGYSSYWNSGLNTYLSGNLIQFNQIVCYKNHISPYRWLSSEQWYQPNNYSGKTFLLIDFEGNLTPELKDCSKEEVISQFGNPEKIITISLSPDKPLLLIYDYNISKKF